MCRRRVDPVPVQRRDLGRLREPAIRLVELTAEKQRFAEGTTDDWSPVRLWTLELGGTAGVLERAADVAPGDRASERGEARLDRGETVRQRSRVEPTQPLYRRD